MRPRLVATLRPTRARQYRRPGGAWDLPPLPTLLRQAPGRPDALVDGDRRWSTGELFAAAARLAGALRESGVRRGDAVAWQLPNGHEAVLCYLAAWHLGAVAAPVHERAGTGDVERIVDRLQPAACVGAAHLPLAELPGAVALGGGALPARRRPAPGDAGAGRSMADWIADADPVPEPDARPSDFAAVLFTAGSSGEPKGVLHTHRTLGYKARTMPAVHGLGTADTVLMPAPLAHVSGLLNGLLVPLVAGMRSVLMARWNASVALELVERERVTFMVGPPTFFVGLTGAPDFSTRKVRSLRLVSCGGAGVTAAFARDAAAALGATVKRTYGATEAPTVATSTAADDPARAASHDGHAIGEVELRVVTPGGTRDAAAGEEGELLVRGPEVFVGYLDEQQTRDAVARGGWWRTGDLATLDADGWLTITGRLKDVIIRGGENIAASAVESILEAHPEVRQAVAVGAPDELLGERVVAVVVLEDGSDFDLAASRRWFESRGAAKTIWPERIVAVEALPTLPAGKPDRAALRTRLAAGGP